MSRPDNPSDPDWSSLAEPGPREASAAARAGARALRDYFLALVAEGFTQSQALEIVGHVLRANGNG